METTTTTKKTGISYIGAFFAMLITFLGGIYVGAHPSWVPSRWFVNAENYGPSKNAQTPTTSPDPSKDASHTTKPAS